MVSLNIDLISTLFSLNVGKQHAQEFMAVKKPIMPSKHFISTYFLAFHKDPVISRMNEPTSENDSDS